MSRVEGGGRFGEVGDGGTSFGPFQLHVGGALPPGRNAAWANSAAGVLYAMQHMSTVARGLRGLPAVQAIVSRFERPAAPGPEIASAWSGYRSFGAPLPSGYAAGGGGADTQNAQFNPLGGQWIQQMKQFQLQQAHQFQVSQANLLKQLTQQAAQTRQQNLVAGIQAQAAQRVQGAQQAQQQVSGAGSLTASGVPALGQYDQKKGILDTIRLEALKRAGIG